MQEYRVGNAIVRIHPGKRTEEERREAIEKAAVRFLKEVHKKKKTREGERSDGKRKPITHEAANS